VVDAMNRAGELCVTTAPFSHGFHEMSHQTTLFRTFRRPVSFVAFVRRCTSPLDKTEVGKAAAVASTDVSCLKVELAEVGQTAATYETGY
jgi:hypothetical protein